MTALIPEPQDTSVTAEMDAHLRATAVIEAINAALPQGAQGLPPIPVNYVFRKRDRESVSAALHGAFELMGGVPALVQWGRNNPDKFMPLWAKLLQSDAETAAGGTTIIVQSAIPASTLDLVNVNAGGRVYHVDAQIDELPE